MSDEVRTVTTNSFAPHPVVEHIVTVVQDGQELTDEQRQRVCAWLSANGIDPAAVARDGITLEYKMFGEKKGRQFIGFYQYHLENGRKVHALVTNDVVKFHRYVEQSVELEPDPTWTGWEAVEAHHAELRAQAAKVSP